MTAPHSERKHAKLSASGASRWWKCPGSIRLSEGLAEPPTSEAAAEGTRAHEWAEYLLREGVCDAREFVGAPTFNGCPAHPLSEAQADAINIYLDAVWAALADTDNTELFVENTFIYPGIDPDLGGTGDACVLNTKLGELDIFDFKNGWFPVRVEENLQLLQYALGATIKFHNHAIKTIRLHVIQPRDGFKPVKTETYSRMELFDYTQKLRAAVAATKDPEAPVVPGEHCTFCPAAYHMACETRRAFTEAQAASGFEVITAAQAVQHGPDKLAELAASLPVIQDYADKLASFLKRETRAGRVPGKKVVAFQIRRKWKEDDTATAAKLLETWPTAEVWKPRELLSPAQLQKATGKKTFDDFDKLMGLTKRVSFGEQIVDVSDERPALAAEAAAGFVPIESGT